MIVVTLGVHVGSGGDGGDVLSESGAELGDGRGAELGDGDAEEAAHDCGALIQVAGSNDAGSGAVLGKAACGIGTGVPALVRTFATTAVLGVGCPGSSHPSPSRKTTVAPCNSPWTTQVNLG